jgi:hypothetical protein
MAGPIEEITGFFNNIFNKIVDFVNPSIKYVNNCNQPNIEEFIQILNNLLQERNGIKFTEAINNFFTICNINNEVQKSKYGEAKTIFYKLENVFRSIDEYIKLSSVIYDYNVHTIHILFNGSDTIITVENSENTEQDISITLDEYSIEDINTAIATNDDIKYERQPMHRHSRNRSRSPVRDSNEPLLDNKYLKYKIKYLKLKNKMI